MVSSAPTKKNAVTSISKQSQIDALNNQLQFSKVELSAQVDLLNVIMETNVFGNDVKSVAPTQAAALKAIEENK